VGILRRESADSGRPTSEECESEDQVNKLIELLKRLEEERFYGTVSLEFKAGERFLVRKEQTLKLNDEKEGTTRNGYRY